MAGGNVFLMADRPSDRRATLTHKNDSNETSVAIAKWCYSVPLVALVGLVFLGKKQEKQRKIAFFQENH